MPALSIEIKTYGSFRQGRQAKIQMDYVKGMTLRAVVETLGIDPQAVGIVKINDSTGQLQDALDQTIPDNSSIDFLPYISGG